MVVRASPAQNMAPSTSILPSMGSTGSRARMRPRGVSSRLVSMASISRSITSASMTASMGGASTHLERNWPTGPSLSSLMARVSSCSGVRNISATMCSGIASNL